MKSARTVLVFVWTSLIAAVATNFFSNWAQPYFHNLWVVGATAGALGILAATTFFVHRASARQRLAEDFAVVTYSEALEPAHLRFVESAPGSRLNPVDRPYAANLYVPRRVLSYQQRHSTSPAGTLSEQDLTELLRSGNTLLIVGASMEGKTRTAFELLKRLAGYRIVVPHATTARSANSLRTLSEEPLLLLLDDVREITPDVVEMMTLVHTLKAEGRRVSAIGTCREDLILAELHFGAMSSSRFIELFDYVVSLQKPTEAEQAQLKSAYGHPHEQQFPTLGSICMKDGLERKRVDFGLLPLSTQQFFHAIQLLSAAGIACSRRRLVATLKAMYVVDVPHDQLERHIDRLCMAGFLLSRSASDTSYPEDALATGAEAVHYYRAGVRPIDDFATLHEALLAERDCDGMNSLAAAFYSLGRPHEAVSAWKTVIELNDSEVAPVPFTTLCEAFLNRGVVLGQLGRTHEELADYDRLLEVGQTVETPQAQEAMARACLHRGMVFEQRHEYERALREYGRVSAHTNGSPFDRATELACEARIAQGLILESRGHTQEAFSAYEEVVHVLKHQNSHTAGELSATALLAMGGLVSSESVSWDLRTSSSPYVEVIHRFGGSADDRWRGYVARAMVGEARRLMHVTPDEQARRACEEVLRMFNNASAAELRDACDEATRLLVAYGFTPEARPAH